MCSLLLYIVSVVVLFCLFVVPFLLFVVCCNTCFAIVLLRWQQELYLEGSQSRSSIQWTS